MLQTEQKKTVIRSIICNNNNKKISHLKHINQQILPPPPPPNLPLWARAPTSPSAKSVLNRSTFNYVIELFDHRSTYRDMKLLNIISCCGGAEGGAYCSSLSIAEPSIKRQIIKMNHSGLSSRCLPDPANQVVYSLHSHGSSHDDYTFGYRPRGVRGRRWLYTIHEKYFRYQKVHFILKNAKVLQIINIFN